MTNYIGRDIDRISNVEVLDNIIFDGSSSYTLQKGGVNFTPNSAQSIILGIDGITQIGNFSVNGSTIDFGVAVANTSTCNYIIHLGTGLLTAPSDGSVTNAKLGTAPTLEAKGSGGTAGGVKYFCEAGTHGVTIRSPAHANYSGSYELKLPTAQGSADTFLKNDGSGNLSFASAGGITEIDMWRLNNNFTGSGSSTYALINNYWERADSDGFIKKGTGLTESSGIFTFPSTGRYLFNWNFETSQNNDQYIRLKMMFGGSSGNNSKVSEDVSGANATGYASVSSSVIINCTDVADKFTFYNSLSNGNLEADSGSNRSGFTMIKLD
jgi:hypothetical protein